MISIKDIEEIVIEFLSDFMSVGSIYTEDDTPEGKVTAERITVIVKKLKTQTYFNKCFVEVNWGVPDITGRPDTTGLQEVSRQMADVESVGEYDGTGYRFGVESQRILKSDLDCHYVNTRLLFEILNTK